MSEDSNSNRDQKKQTEAGVAPDFSGSLGKGMLAKEKIETLGNSSGLTPLGFGVNVRNMIMDRDSAGVGFSTTEYAENTEILNNSSGLSPFDPFGEIYSMNKKSLSMAEDFSETEGLETFRNSSGLTPLNFDSELQIKAPGVMPLQGIRGFEKLQGFCNDDSPQRKLITQSPVITNFAYKGEWIE